MKNFYHFTESSSTNSLGSDYGITNAELKKKRIEKGFQLYDEVLEDILKSISLGESKDKPEINYNTYTNPLEWLKNGYGIQKRRITRREIF